MFASTLRLLLQVFCCAGALTATAFGQARTDGDGGPSGSLLPTNSEVPDAAPDGLAAGDWASIRAAYEEGLHTAYGVEGGGYEARNPGQQWKASFDGRVLAGAHFGFSVSVSGNRTAVGAFNVSSEGAAYTFVRNGAMWSEDYLRASNPGFFDTFGLSVSLSDDVLVIGAPAEDGGSSGVNGDQTDNSVTDSGAAYVFAICPPETFCIGKTTSAGCIPFVSFSGTPSATSGAFDFLSNDHIEAEPAIYLYSLMKANLNFHGGKLCVKAPFKRLTTLIKATDGLACSGCAGNCRMFKRDFNELIQSGSDPALTAGQKVYLQVHQSDPNDPLGFGDNLSDALSFVIGG